MFVILDSESILGVPLVPSVKIVDAPSEAVVRRIPPLVPSQKIKSFGPAASSFLYTITCECPKCDKLFDVQRYVEQFAPIDPESCRITCFDCSIKR